MTGAGTDEAPDAAMARGMDVAAAPGTLYIVATPIGNLGDVTLRALEVLRTVPLIAAEDTRHTRRLLERHDVPTRTTSYHAQSDPGRTRAFLREFRWLALRLVAAARLDIWAP